jgi:hypothetical protein
LTPVRAFPPTPERATRAFFGEGNTSQFIEDDQTIASIPFGLSGLRCGSGCFQKFVGQTTTGNKMGGDALTAGLQPQTRGQVGLPGAALAQKDDFALLADIFHGGQLM